MSSYAEALQDFYRGEVLGEAVYSALLGSARNDDERLKLGTLLQLETETKAWLRAPMVAHGVSLEEQSAVREEGVAVTGQLKPMSLVGADASSPSCNLHRIRSSLSKSRRRGQSAGQDGRGGSLPLHGRA